MEKKTATATEPVAWSNGKTTMYQARISHRLKKERTISIYGDPARTKELAQQALREELEAWTEAITAFNKIINKEEQKNV